MLEWQMGFYNTSASVYLLKHRLSSSIFVLKKKINKSIYEAEAIM